MLPNRASTPPHLNTGISLTNRLWLVGSSKGAQRLPEIFIYVAYQDDKNITCEIPYVRSTKLILSVIFDSESDIYKENTQKYEMYLF